MASSLAASSPQPLELQTACFAMLLPPIEGSGPSRPSSRSRSPEPCRASSYKGVQLKNHIKAKFHELDVNKDGCLSLEELTVFLGCLSSKLRAQEVREIFRRMDRNRSGLRQLSCCNRET